ncbi:MAG: hypothetical protein KGI27_13800 [Thaumarchaeota archaeon]|nr:hypothetical protein [Nitrososphaerota archaeon]
MAAFSALGAAIGRGVYFAHDVHTLFPMLNILLIGPSGIGKTTSLELGSGLIRSSPELLEHTPVILGKATPEKLHEDLVAAPKSIIFAEELAAFFNKQKYMEGMIPYCCCVPETKVLTADLNWKSVGELFVDEELVGFDEWPTPTFRYHRRAKVTATGRKKLPCVRITTSKGAITVSTEHPFLCRHRDLKENQHWILAENLKPGTEILYFGPPWEYKENYRTGYLAGIYDGEGHTAKYNVSFVQKEGAVLEHAHKLVAEDKMLHISKYKHSSHGTRTIRVAKFYDRLRLLGTIRPIRLLTQAAKTWENQIISCGPNRENSLAKVESVLFIGEQEVVTLETDTHTLITEGYYTHNTALLNYPDVVELRTKHEGITKIDKPSVTIMGGSTPEWLQDQLPDSATTGGFLARFFIVFEEYKFRRIALPGLAMGREAKRALEDKRDQVIREFGTLVTAASGEMVFSDWTAIDEYTKWYNEYRPESGFLSPFAARAGEFILRLACLCAISRKHSRIDRYDIRFSIRFYELCARKLGRVVIPFSPDGKLLDQVLHSIGQREMSQVEIRRAMRNVASAHRVDLLVDSLLASEDLVRLKNGQLRRLNV